MSKPQMCHATMSSFLLTFYGGYYKGLRLGQAFYDFYKLHKMHKLPSGAENIYGLDGSEALDAIYTAWEFV